jgi:hypothetical protein
MCLGDSALTGRVGILLPVLNRILTRLAVLAWNFCAVLRILAIGFRVSCGKFALMPFKSSCLFWDTATLFMLPMFMLRNRAKA